MLYFARRYVDAIRVLQELLEVSPDYAEAPLILGGCYWQLGRYQEAIKQYQDFMALTGDTLTTLRQLIPVYTSMGDTMKARELFDDYMSMLDETKVSMFGKESPTVAAVYAALNEKDKAFDWLERAFNERNRYLVDIKFWVEFDSLRSDPRYGALLRKMGLDP